MRPPGRRVRYEDMEIAAAIDYVRTNHQAVLYTRRADGSPQLSPITLDVDGAGLVVISSRETAYKVRNLRRDPRCSLCVFPDTWVGRWVQLDGTADLLSLPDALEPLVAYYRGLRGEHPDWDDYRAAMVREQRLLIRVTVERAGPDRSG
jgi:PPOX class probable F420-dependent enzyme